MNPHSSLGRRVGRSPLSEDEIFEIARGYWIRYGIPLIPLGKVSNDWSRQIIINECNGLYGQTQAKVTDSPDPKA